MSATIITGDAVEQLAILPAGQFHCAVTSPPYWGLRDYGIAGQLGNEKTPEEYIANMLLVFAGVWRVLRDDGTLWLNLGNSYANPSQSGGGDPTIGTRNLGGVRQPKVAVPSGLKPKDLVGIPWRVAFALQAAGWYLRSDIIWEKPNAMPLSVKDRPTTNHEYLFLLAKKQRYFYDAVAIAEPSKTKDMRRPYGSKGMWKVDGRPEEQQHGGEPRYPGNRTARDGVDEKGGNQGNGMIPNTPTRNKRSVWRIPTHGFKAAHFATFPPKLVEPCIMAGTSERGCCAECGAQQVRLIEKVRRATRPGEKTKVKVPGGWDIGAGAHGTVHRNGRTEATYRETAEVGNRDPERHVTETTTVGWIPSCKCGAGVVPCRVLDPFAGAGTTGVVCSRFGRDFTGIELNTEYAELARRRIAETQPELFG